MTDTPFSEGRRAGYRGEPNNNPYRRGIPELWCSKQIVHAQEWDAGYLEGQEQAHDDVIARRLEACR